MIEINVKGLPEVVAMLAAVPKQATRATEIALDKTAKAIREDVRGQMCKVFDRPVPYTLNSLAITPTKNHNMEARVWFKTPERMGQHYLVPQVEGGAHKLKGSERGIGLGELIPGQGAALNRYGNITVKQYQAALAGIKRGSRAYVVLTRHKTLPPGVYQRFKTGRGFGKGLSKAPLQRGRTRGRYTSAVLAKGLKPIMLQGRQGDAVKPLLDFYGLAHATFNRRFMPLFWSTLERQLRR